MEKQEGQIAATVNSLVCQSQCDEGGDFCTFFGGYCSYPIDTVGCRWFDGMDGLVLVSRKACTRESGSFNSRADGGLARGSLAPLGKLARNLMKWNLDGLGNTRM